MANKCCGQDTCSCLIQSGDGIVVTGSGTQSAPYVVALDTSTFNPSLTVNDSPTVNLTLTGSGIPGDPYLLRADASIAVADLTDVNAGTPNAGDVLTWDIPTQEWVAAPAPANPSGSVNVGAGLSGTGAVATPIELEVSGTDPGGGVTGLAIYIDGAGELRAMPMAWGDITGKPATFPPSPHTHPDTQITNQQGLMVGGFNAAQAAGGSGVVGPFPVEIGTTENVAWPNGTLWFNPQL